MSTSNPVVGRQVNPRTPGDPDPDRVDPQPNAGRPAPARAATASELQEQAHAAEVHAMSPSTPSPKATMPLRGVQDEEMTSMKAQLAELREENKRKTDQQRELMEANRALLRQIRVVSPDMPKAPELPKLDEMQKLQDAGALRQAVLTEQGWIVPRVTVENPEQQTVAAIVHELRTGDKVQAEAMSKSRTENDEAAKEAIEKSKKAVAERANERTSGR